jgi:hypothetical protein
MQQKPVKRSEGEGEGEDESVSSLASVKNRLAGVRENVQLQLENPITDEIISVRDNSKYCQENVINAYKNLYSAAVINEPRRDNSNELTMKSMIPTSHDFIQGRAK